MLKILKAAMLLSLPASLWAQQIGQNAINTHCTISIANAPCAAASSLHTHTNPVAGNAPLSTGSSIAIASNTSESSVTNLIPHLQTRGTSQGSGGHQASAILTGPGVAAAGGYTQSNADVKTNTFHLGYMTRITTNSINSVKDYSWASATSTGAGQTRLSATGNAVSATSAFVTAAGLSANSNGNATSTATANATLSGPGTASVSTTTWSSSASHAQIVFNNNLPVSSSAASSNQAGGFGQVSISGFTVTQPQVNVNVVSKTTGSISTRAAGSAAAAQPVGGGLTVNRVAPFASGRQTQMGMQQNTLATHHNFVTQSILSGRHIGIVSTPSSKGK